MRGFLFISLFVDVEGGEEGLISLAVAFCVAGKFIQATGAFRRACCYVEEMVPSPERKVGEHSLFCYWQW